MPPQIPDASLLDRFRRNQCTDDEHRRVIRWLQSLPPDELSTFLDAHQQQVLTGDIRPNVDTDLPFSRITDRINQPSARQVWFRPMITYRIAGIAAAVLVVWFVWPWLQRAIDSRIPIAVATQPASAPEFQIVRTANQPRTVVLPDSSRVTLAEHSLLRFPVRFGAKKRTVLLTGEGFFAVRRQPERPFVVRTNALRTQVLGTSFTVRARAGQFEEVIVRTGRVAVAGVEKQTNDSPGRIELRAGQRVRFDRERLTFAPVQTDNAFPATRPVTAPTTPEPDAAKPSETFSMAFNKTPLPEVVRALETEFNVTITVASPELIEARVTVRLRGRSINELLSQLTRSIGARHEQQENTIILTKI